MSVTSCGWQVVVTHVGEGKMGFELLQYLASLPSKPISLVFTQTTAHLAEVPCATTHRCVPTDVLAARPTSMAASGITRMHRPCWMLFFVIRARFTKTTEPRPCPLLLGGVPAGIRRWRCSRACAPTRLGLITTGRCAHSPRQQNQSKYPPATRQPELARHG